MDLQSEKSKIEGKISLISTTISSLTKEIEKVESIFFLNLQNQPLHKPKLIKNYFCFLLYYR